MTYRWTVAVLWRGGEDARRAGIASNERLRPIFDALAAVGIEARPVVHRDEIAPSVRDDLHSVDGVLVWVDPIGRGEDRRCLDAILREASANGVWVSAHPDVIAAMGTKEVLHRTRHLGWGSDIHRYDTLEDLRHGLRARLPEGPRVLKPRYANGGIGVWKVEHAGARADAANPVVRVHGAELRDTSVEDIRLEELLARCVAAFEHGGCVVDQPFQPRVAEGMIRCYLVADQVVGFARQSAESLLTEPGAAARIMGLPSPKTMFPPDAPTFGRLRALVEHEWVPGLQALLDLAIGDLPVLWDADFLLGPPSASGEDTYVLCEINCSSVTPFPPDAPTPIARAVRERLAHHRQPVVP
jgi:hypothetical protein